MRARNRETPSRLSHHLLPPSLPAPTDANIQFANPQKTWRRYEMAGRKAFLITSQISYPMTNGFSPVSWFLQSTVGYLNAIRLNARSPFQLHRPLTSKRTPIFRLLRPHFSCSYPIFISSFLLNLPVRPSIPCYLYFYSYQCCHCCSTNLSITYCQQLSISLSASLFHFRFLYN